MQKLKKSDFFLKMRSRLQKCPAKRRKNPLKRNSASSHSARPRPFFPPPPPFFQRTTPGAEIKRKQEKGMNRKKRKEKREEAGGASSLIFQYSLIQMR